MDKYQRVLQYFTEPSGELKYNREELISPILSEQQELIYYPLKVLG